MSKVTTTIRKSKHHTCFSCNQPFAAEKFHSAGHQFCDLSCKDNFIQKNESERRSS